MSLLKSHDGRFSLSARAHLHGSTTVGYVAVVVAGLFVGAIVGFVVALFAGLIPFRC